MIKSRVERIKNSLEENTAALVCSPSNRFYLTGFNSTAGRILITRKEAFFLIDFRYFEHAKATVDSCTVLLSKSSTREIADLCKAHNISKLYIETEELCVAKMNEYKAQLDGVEISSENMLDLLLQDMRSIKTQKELEIIQTAQSFTDETFSYILPRIVSGRSEREIMLDMEYHLRKLGADGVAFEFIVASGKNSAVPHASPTDKKIEKGDFVTMDFGALYCGYRSDMTRTVAVGSVSAEQKTVYNTVLEAQLKALQIIKSGLLCKEIDLLARNVIKEAGFDGAFGHALGHSVGIDIHENPAFSPRSEEYLKTGNVITVEPGIYLENRFGVRIEDMVSVTKNGCINLTKSKKDLIIL